MTLASPRMGALNGWTGSAPVHRFSHQAMATTFEIFCLHSDAIYARQAAWAAFDLVNRIEQDLSRFIENSDIARVNSLQLGESVRVSRSTMECLMLSRLGYAETCGAFDISLGSGLEELELAPDRLRVCAGANGIRLDLGGIGKGYALDRVAELLADWEVSEALIHGGFSSVVALEAPAGTNGWPLTLSVPSDDCADPIAVVQARRMALSASGLRKGAHIRNTTANPECDVRTAAWAAASVERLAAFCKEAQRLSGADRPMSNSPAAAAEVFSTAFMILGSRQVKDCCNRWRGLEAWLIDDRSSRPNGRDLVMHVPKGNSKNDVCQTTPQVDGGCTRH